MSRKMREQRMRALECIPDISGEGKIGLAKSIHLCYIIGDIRRATEHKKELLWPENAMYVGKRGSTVLR
jgi:hypothetical protein